MPHGCMGVVGPLTGLLSNNFPDDGEGPTPIIDLGCGHGFMGATIWNLWPHKVIVGIEAQARYGNGMWDLYREVRIADIRVEVPAMIERGERYHFGLFFEILEHLTKPDGEALMRVLPQLAPRWIMSTPNLYFGAIWHQWDKHQCLWEREELEAFGWQLLDPRGVNDRDGSMAPLTWTECGWPMWFGVLGEWDLSRRSEYEVRSPLPE